MGVTGMPRESVLKRGTVFYARCSYVDALGEPVDLVEAGITIASAVKTARGAVLPVETRFLDQATARGRFDLVASTAAWPIGALTWDILTRQGGLVVSSGTARVVVQPSVTPPQALAPPGTDLDALVITPTVTATLVGGFPGPQGKPGTLPPVIDGGHF